MGPATNPHSRTIYGKQNPLINKKKCPQPTYKRKEQFKLKRAAKIIAAYCIIMMESRQRAYTEEPWR